MNNELSKREAFGILTSQGWLSEQPKAFQNRLLIDAVVREYEASRILFDAGEPKTGMIALARGTLAMYWDHPQLGQYIFDVARPVMWLGEGIAFGLPHRVISVQVRTTATVVHVSRQSIDALVLESPLMLRSFGLLSSTHVSELLKMVGELLYQDPYTRVAARIASMGHAYVAAPANKHISLQVTQDDLASLCNLSRKTLNRVLGSLKQRGALEPGYGSITVINMSKLCEIAAGQERAGLARSVRMDDDEPLPD